MVQVLVCIVVLNHNYCHILYYITRYHEYMWYWVWIIKSHYFRICMLCISSGWCATSWSLCVLCIHDAGQSPGALTRHTAGWANRTNCFICCARRRIYYQKLVVLQNDQNQLTVTWSELYVSRYSITRSSRYTYSIIITYLFNLRAISFYVCDDFY